MDDKEQTIREQAYRIWEAAGRPDGSHDDHWRRAEEQYGSTEQVDADETTDENWKVEAGLTEDKPALNITPTIVTPD